MCRVSRNRNHRSIICCGVEGLYQVCRTVCQALPICSDPGHLSNWLWLLAGHREEPRKLPSNRTARYSQIQPAQEVTNLRLKPKTNLVNASICFNRQKNPARGGEKKMFGQLEPRHSAKAESEKQRYTESDMRCKHWLGPPESRFIQKWLNLPKLSNNQTDNASKFQFGKCEVFDISAYPDSKFKQIQGYKRANPWHGKQANDARVEGYPSHTGTQSHVHNLSIPFIRMICELCAWPPFPSPQCPQRFCSTIQGTLCRQQATHIAEQKAYKQRISCSRTCCPHLPAAFCHRIDCFWLTLEPGKSWLFGQAKSVCDEKGHGSAWSLNNRSIKGISTRTETTPRMSFSEGSLFSNGNPSLAQSMRL